MSQSIRRALYRAKGLPDPGPSPSFMLTELTIVVDREVAKSIDELHELVTAHYPSRNDFLVDLLREGLRGAFEAGVEAEKARVALQHPDHVEPRPVEITNPGLDAAERDVISSRLAFLRGQEQGGVTAVERAD